MSRAGDRVWLAVDETTADLTPDDQVLAEAIRAAGGKVTPVIWGRPVPRHAMLVIRSTWDYVDNPSGFRAWLDQLDADEVIVHNPTSLLRRNLHKGYLVDLGEGGVPIVPTVVLPRYHRLDLAALMHVHGWNDAVVKPAIGGTARGAVHVGRAGHDAAQAQLAELLANEDVVVQQFVPSVPAAGEISVVAIGGVPTHAVRKRAVDGEWRVQTEFGGTVELVDLSDRLVGAARTALAAVRPTPLYARIDLVAAERGELQVIELELVEPELFFRLSPPAAARMAQLLGARHRR